MINRDPEKELLEEEHKVKEAFIKHQDFIRKIKTSNEMNYTNYCKCDQKKKKWPIMTSRQKTATSSNFNVPLGITKLSLQNKFALDYTSSQQIKNKQKTVQGSSQTLIKHPLAN